MMFGGRLLTVWKPVEKRAHRFNVAVAVGHERENSQEDLDVSIMEVRVGQPDEPAPYRFKIDALECLQGFRVIKARADLLRTEVQAADVQPVEYFDDRGVDSS